MHHIQEVLILVQRENGHEIVNSIVCLFYFSRVSSMIQGNESLIHAYGSTTHFKYTQDPCTCAGLVPKETA